MRVRKIVHKAVQVNREGIHLAGGIDAAINANIGGSGSGSSATSRQVRRIDQQGSGRRATGGEGQTGRHETGDQDKEVEP